MIATSWDDVVGLVVAVVVVLYLLVVIAHPERF